MSIAPGRWPAARPSPPGSRPRASSPAGPGVLSRPTSGSSVSSTFGSGTSPSSPTSTWTRRSARARTTRRSAHRSATASAPTWWRAPSRPGRRRHASASRSAAPRVRAARGPRPSRSVPSPPRGERLELQCLSRWRDSQGRRHSMRYRPFGRTGLSVSVVGFGCWPMAGDRYGAIEDDEAVKAIHRALDRGVNCVDTAPAYGGGHSEEVVARALEKRRRDVILVTKCGVKPPPPGQLGPIRDASRANILREVDASLKRLRTDWVDALLVHWPDAATPFEDTMRALDEVVSSGCARFVGVSNFTGAMIAECLRTRRVDVSQVGYHMFDW